MTKHNIDHIIESKFEGLNFEFKDEYWNQMEKKINSNAASRASSGSSIFGTSLTSILVISITTIATLLMIYFWIFRGQSTENELNIDSAIEEQIQSKSPDQTPVNQIYDPIDEQEDNTSTLEEEVTDKVVIMETRKHSPKKLSHTKELNSNEQNTSENVEKEEPVKNVATSIETYDTTKEILDEPKEELDKVQSPETNIDNQITENKNSSDNTTIKENKELTKQTVSVENDSIYIPDAKLVGDKQNDQNRSGQVEIEAGPKQVKTVKPKNKPVKHVFKKRKGLLYRLGIRK
ncbi:MAG: hypothetical protein DRI84_03305 [Bacteroidetes bacterium]|nr:MAG: hypothetical protein DRI84_03305 [Bacteroidota bacterium]